MLKKSWFFYNSIILGALVILYGMTYGNDLLYQNGVYWLANSEQGFANSRYVIIAGWVFVLNTLFFVPIWLIVLAFKRKSLPVQAFWIGFGLFLLSFIPGVSSIVGIIGYAYGET